MTQAARSRAPRIAGIYALFGALWILISDSVVFALTSDPDRLAWIQTGKGWFFVTISSLLVYLLVRRADEQEAARRAESRKHAEERYEVTQRLDQVLASIGDGVAVVRERRIQHVNPAFCELFEYEADELIGLETRLLHVDDPHFRRFAQLGGPPLRREGTFRATYSMRRRSGEIFPTEHTVTLLNPDRGIEGGLVNVVRDITELVEVRRRRRDRRRELEQSTEEERRRIARELHDGPGQTLPGVRMKLAAARDRIPDDPEARQRIAEADRLVAETVEQLRGAIDALRPPVLDTFGLLEAIESLCEGFQERTGKSCRFRSTVASLGFPGERQIHLYRIVQEALRNVERHAAAEGVEVQLSAVDSELLLEIRDDGRGIRPGPSAGAGRYGIAGMRERADILEGNLVVDPRPEGGTVVRLTCPSSERSGDDEG